MNTINRLNSIYFSGHRGRALDILEQATLKRHPLTRGDWVAAWRDCADGRVRCPICGCEIRLYPSEGWAAQCSDGYCVANTLPEHLTDAQLDALEEEARAWAAGLPQGEGRRE